MTAPIAIAVALIFSGCSHRSQEAKSPPTEAGSGLLQARAASPTPASAPQVVRATGIVQALDWQSLRVPQLTGVTNFQITLTRIIPNGLKVSKGDILIEFDRLELLDQERDAVALLESLQHQLQERKAQIESLQATRGSQIREAQADLDRARLQLRKGPVLSEIDRMKNEAKAENSALRLDSLKRSNALRLVAEQASVRILELKSQRQSVTLERLRTNLDRLVIKAPQDGMIAHESIWRQGSMGPPQVGDRMWAGMPVLRIFNPDRMVVQATVDEPDFASLTSGARARVYLDAYPGESFTATLQSASPVATAGFDTPVRNFTAVFRLDQHSPRLLPDLSAALEIDRLPPAASEAARTASVTKVKPSVAKVSE